MKRVQLFNSTGIKGVVMWIGGPLISGAGYAWALPSIARGADLPFATILMLAAGALMTLSSVPMMLIGREQYEE